jgi:hypothetical protein
MVQERLSFPGAYLPQLFFLEGDLEQCATIMLHECILKKELLRCSMIARSPQSRLHRAPRLKTYRITLTRWSQIPPEDHFESC